MAGPVLEFFTLADLAERCSRVPADVRAGVRAELRASAQKRAAACALWGSGHTAEALRVSRDAFLVARRAADRLATSGLAEPGAGDGARLGALGLARMRAAAVADADHAAKTLVVPDLDDDVRWEHHDALRALLEGQDVLAGRAADLCSTGGRLVLRRIVRIAGTLVAVLAVAAAVAAAAIPKRGIHAIASARWANSDEFDAANLLDGKRQTEWLLPDNEAGSVEIVMVPSRHVRELRILNAHNRTFNDRATRAYRIEIIGDDGRVARSIPGTFATLTPRPAWTSIAINADDVARIRIQIQTWFQKGGGLAEIQVVE